MKAEYFMLFYKIGVLVAFFFYLYELIFEKDKINKIHDHFGFSKSVKYALMLFSFVIAMVMSWLYVGDKISDLINKEDITKKLK